MDYDKPRAIAFTNRVVGMVNDAALVAMFSVGHQTGLFDTMAGLPPSTSAAIAEAAGLDERYVREWLGAMTVGRIVEYDPATARYLFPPEHASCLTRAAGPRNLAGQSQQITQLGTVEAGIVECFRHGGGLGYEHFPDFHRVMGENSAQRYDRALIPVVLPLVPGLLARLEAGIDVADIACGSGHAINLMAKAFPASRFTGIDISTQAIARARAEAEAMGATNATFETADAARLHGPARYDFVTTFDAIHDQAEPDRVLAGIATMLRDGGAYLCVDVGASSKLEENMGHRLGPMLYTVSTMHCMTVSLAAGGMGLGTMWGEQKAYDMLHAAGFRDVTTHHVEGDPVNNYYIAHK